MSSAFRETNYEPELLLRHYGGPPLFGGKFAGFDVGLNHQSNGRGEAPSRSWNRVIAQTFLDCGDLVFAVRGWYRIPEDDDNPHMHRYYGFGESPLDYDQRVERVRIGVSISDSLMR